MTEPIDPQPVIYALSAIGVALAIIIGVWQHFRGKKREEPAPAPKDDTPRCAYCDAPAVRAPSLFTGSEGWGAEIRVRFGAAQAYVPRVAVDLAPSLCPGHARTWDALLAEKVATTIERERRAAEVRIAQEMAAFESEGLAQAMLSSLTDGQRKAYEKRKREKPADGA